MKRRKVVIFVLAALLLMVTAACSGGNEAPPPADNGGNNVEEPAAQEPEPTEEVVEAPELFGDALRGGLLYDKWWVPVGMDTPSEDHPLWATQSSNTRGGGDTWRCKECHGWDYKGADGAYGSGSHFTGFPGVIGFSGGDANEVLAIMQGSTNQYHDFSSVMDEQALTDLALFITQETIDYASLVAEDKMAVSSDTGLGESLYSDTCVECHGPEGLAINFGHLVTDLEYVSAIATGNPWEFLHKARFGQPGTDMPSALDQGWSEEEQGALLAYAQTLPGENPATQGGQLYDKWWGAMGADAPESNNPLWSTQSSNTREGGDTWRCKECHGWDYKGADGAYGSGSHFTGFAGVFGASESTAEELTAWLTGAVNSDHDFSAYGSDAELAMLVAFLQEGMTDMSVYINADKTVNGDAANGETLYTATCERCHGADGKAMNFGSDDDPEYLPDLASGNPWEAFHKIANGQPGKSMPSALNLGWSWQDIADLVAYIQTLFTE